MGKKLSSAVLKQFLYHLLNIFITIFLMAPLWSLFDKVQNLYSLITGWIYFVTMYSIGWNFGNRDARKIPGFYPDKKFPFIAAALGLIIPIILLIMRFALPDIWHVSLPFINGETDFLFKGNTLHGMTDFIFRMWYFPLEAFITSGSALSCILIIFVQPAALIAGYFVGLKRFRITEALFGKMLYEKNQNRKNKKKNNKRVL